MRLPALALPTEAFPAAFPVAFLAVFAGGAAFFEAADFEGEAFGTRTVPLLATLAAGTAAFVFDFFEGRDFSLLTDVIAREVLSGERREEKRNGVRTLDFSSRRAPGATSNACGT